MTRHIQETPESIVLNGRMCDGVFREPFRRMNLEEADIYKGSFMRPLKRFRLKEWLGFGIEHPDWHVTAFITNAKYLSSAVFSAYRRSNGALVKHTGARPGGVPMSRNHWDDRCIFASRGFSIEFHNHLDAGEHRITVDIRATRRQPAVTADILLGEDLSRVQPLVVSIPIGPNHSIFTHKSPQPASGVVRVGNDEITFDPSRDLCLMDEHKSYLPWHTSWRWATFAGRDARGRIIGLNIGDHDYVNDQESLNENAAWVGENLSLLGAAGFELSKSDHTQPWRIWERNGRAELTFHPEHTNVENHNMGLVRMNYFQSGGRFRGFIIDDAGEKHAIDNYLGVAEMMDSLW